MTKHLPFYFQRPGSLRTTADTNDFPLVKVNGQTLTNVYVSSFNATDVWLYQRAGGRGKFKLSDLPPEVQVRCHYDSSVEARLNAQAQATAHDRLEVEKAKRYRMVENGEILISSLTNLDGKIVQVKDSGGILLQRYEMVGRIDRSPVGGMASMGGFVGGAGGSLAYQTRELGEKVVFVKCDVSGLFDGRDWKCSCLSKAEFTYTNTQGAVKTVEKYIASTAYIPN